MWEEVAPKGGREARRAFISSLSRAGRAGSALGLRTDHQAQARLVHAEDQQPRGVGHSS